MTLLVDRSSERFFASFGGKEPEEERGASLKKSWREKGDPCLLALPSPTRT